MQATKETSVTDLDRRFAELDALDASELWPDIEHRIPGPFREPRRRQRALAIAVALVLVASLTTWALTALREPELPLGAQVVTGHDPEIPLECTARLERAVVRPGQTITITVDYRATGKLPYQVLSHPRLLVSFPGGPVVYNTSTGPTTSASLPEGQGNHVPRSGPHVWTLSFNPLWGPRLEVVPFCGYIGEPAEEAPPRRGIQLEPLLVDVQSEGEAPSEEEALSRAIAAAGGLFDHCAPDAGDADTIGELRPPATYEGPELTPIRARCGASIKRFPGFATVDLLFVSPPSLELPTPREDRNRGLHLPTRSEGVQMGRWTFVVTETEVRPATPGTVGILRGGQLGTILVAPRSCGSIEGRSIPCEGLMFVDQEGGWRVESAPWAGVGRFFEQHLSPLVFLRAAVDRAVYLGEPEAVGHFDSQPPGYTLFARRTHLGSELIMKPDSPGKWAGFMIPARDIQPGCPGAIRWARVGTYSGRRVFYAVGATTSGVDSVEAELRDGTRMIGSTFSLPEPYGGDFRVFVLFADVSANFEGGDGVIRTVRFSSADGVETEDECWRR
jgi:hypothetical protein